MPTRMMAFGPGMPRERLYHPIAANGQQRPRGLSGGWLLPPKHPRRVLLNVNAKGLIDFGPVHDLPKAIEQCPGLRLVRMDTSYLANRKTKSSVVGLLQRTSEFRPANNGADAVGSSIVGQIARWSYVGQEEVADIANDPFG